MLVTGLAASFRVVMVKLFCQSVKAVVDQKTPRERLARVNRAQRVRSALGREEEKM